MKRFNIKYKKLGKSWGLAHPEGYIEVDQRLKSKKLLEIIVHECVHLLNPDDSEEAVIRKSIMLTNTLWHEKYRRIDDDGLHIQLQDGTIENSNMIEKIFEHKPKSIHDIIPSEFFTKYDVSDYVYSNNCFEWYYAIAEAIQPKTFMEIGVRFGFSFLPTLLGSDKLEYALGWDLETYGNNDIANENIGKYYNGTCKWEIQHKDSQLETKLPQFFDLISIDGCHDYNCKIHDLIMAMDNCRYAILDDYDYHTDVRNSINQFMRDYTNRIEWGLYIPTFRGSMLIKFKENEQ
jgi:hypothetical protein